MPEEPPLLLGALDIPDIEEPDLESGEERFPTRTQGHKVRSGSPTLVLIILFRRFAGLDTPTEHTAISASDTAKAYQAGLEETMSGEVVDVRDAA